MRAQALYNALVNMAAISFVGLLLLAVSHIQVRKMLSHLEQTRKAVIDLPEGADLSSRLPDTWNDEAGELAAAFKRLNSRVNEYYHRLLPGREGQAPCTADCLTVSAESALLLFLTPFIGFNFSWKTGTWTIRSAMPSAQLGQVLHYNLEEQLTATLMEEKQMAQAYVSLQHQQHEGGRKSPWTLICRNHSAASTVPRFTLQPLLENAIQHGFVKGDRRYTSM